MATCGASATWLAYRIWNLPENLSIITLLFLLIFIRYNYVYFLDLKKTEVERFTYFQILRKRIRILVYAASLIAILLTLTLSLKEFFWLLHIFLICFIYSESFVLWKIVIPPLRNISNLKSFIIAYIWVTSSWLLPLIESKISFDLDMLISTAERFLYYFSLTIMFDLRDAKEDKKTGLITFANQFDLFSLKELVMSVLIFSNFLAYKVYPIQIVYLLWLSNTLTLLLIVIARKKKNALFFMGYLDGMITLQSLIIIIFSYRC